MADEIEIQRILPRPWKDGEIEVFSDGLIRYRTMTRAEYERLYLCEFPPPPKVGDGGVWKGRNVIIRQIEPEGERDRALVQEVETGRERNVRLSLIEAIR